MDGLTVGYMVDLISGIELIIEELRSGKETDPARLEDVLCKCAGIIQDIEIIL